MSNPSFIASLRAAAYSLLLALAATSAAQAAVFSLPSVSLKTAPAAASKVQPFVDGLLQFDAAYTKGGNQLPVDARDRVAKLRAAALAAKSELRGLAARIKAANEVEKFDAYVAAKVAAINSPQLTSEWKAAGGGYAQLLRSDATIDSIVAEREQFLAANTTPVSDVVFQLLGIGSARAALPGFLKTACSFGLFVVTLGYGSDFNYHSCMAQ